MEEYFDIVNENNGLTGERKLRSEAHSLGLWHRVVHIYFFKKSSDQFSFLVHLRSKTKDLHPNVWDARFGGHVQSGESIEEAVVEELQQETGLTVKISDLVRGEVYKKVDSPSNREFVNVYYYHYSGGLSALHFDDGEVQEVKWMECSDILKDMAVQPKNWSGTPQGLQEIADVLSRRLSVDK